MKKSLTIVALLAGAAAAYSQGTVNFTDYVGGAGGFNIHIWSPNPSAPTVEQTGNSSVLFSASHLNGDNPTGTGTYGGTLVGGSGTAPSTTLSYANGDSFDVGLYAAAGTVSTFSTSTFSLIKGTVAQLADASDGTAYAGMFGLNAGAGQQTLNGTGGAPTVAAGAAATFAVAAWFTAGGTLTTLAAAEAVAGTPYGVSPVGSELTGGGGSPPATAPLLPGLGDPQTTAGGITSFSLITTPEPSTVALGVIGASAFLMRLRRKQ